MSDEEIMAALGEPGLPPEGRFYPDTYAYSKGSADLAVLKRARARDAEPAGGGLGDPRARHPAAQRRTTC